MNNQNKEGLRVLINPVLSDRLYTLSAEYSASADLLVNLAVERLLCDVEFLRKLRNGNIASE